MLFPQALVVSSISSFIQESGRTSRQITEMLVQSWVWTSNPMLQESSLPRREMQVRSPAMGWRWSSRGRTALIVRGSCWSRPAVISHRRASSWIPSACRMAPEHWAWDRISYRRSDHVFCDEAELSYLWVFSPRLRDFTYSQSIFPNLLLDFTRMLYRVYALYTCTREA